MSSKKTSATTNPNVQPLRIGSRVRCTDDGVEGRITWANAVSLKIKWDDGEEVTWKRDALASKPIEFLDADAGSADDPAQAPPTTEEQSAPVPLPSTELETPPATAEQTSTTDMPGAEPAPEQPRDSATEPVPLAPEQAVMMEVPTAELATVQELPYASSADSGTESTSASDKPKRQRKAAAAPKEKKVSALDAAARVLAEENRPMTCQEMIEVMAARGYWASPNGATPAATLYSALLREITTKADAARFVKTERGKFALQSAT